MQLKAASTLLLVASCAALKVEFPKFFSFKFHTSGDSDGGYARYAYSEADTWANEFWYERGELLLEYGHSPCKISTHFYLASGSQFGLDWWPRGCGTFACKPFTDGWLTPDKATAMTFPTPTALGNDVAGTWTESPGYFDQYRYFLGAPCSLYSNLDSACTDAYPTDRNNSACWFLPGIARDMYISDSGGLAAGVSRVDLGGRTMDWHAVTDLCFSQNASAPGTLPPWDALVGIAFSTYDSAFEPVSGHKLIPVLDVNTSLAQGPLPRPCADEDEPSHNWDYPYDPNGQY